MNDELTVGKIEFSDKPSTQMFEEVPIPLTVPTVEDLMPDKSVLIDLSNGKRKYIFKGNWTGNDVRLTLTAFPREYKLHQRTVRRGTVKEVTNE